MKNFLILFAAMLFFPPALSTAQTMSMNEIIEKVNNAVTHLEQGQFTIHDRVTTFGTDKDTVRSERSSVCFFKKNSKDSLIGYQTASFREDSYQQIYSGIEFFTIYQNTLEVIIGKDFPEKIKDKFNSTNSPLYIIEINKYIQDNDKRPTKEQLRLTGIERVLSEKCYKLVRVDSSNSERGIEEQYYVSTNSFLPIKTVIIMKQKIGNVEKTTIYDYTITGIKNEPIDTNQFSREALSEYHIEKIYSPEAEAKRDALLPLGTKAPDWKLPLITGDTMVLSDLRGKIVVMDFWFKSCAPCVTQMHELETLHKKYPAEQVVVIGVNTHDDPEKDKLELFLKNRLITTKSVNEGNSIAPLYNVYGSPSLFIIDKKGEIVFTKVGYTPSLLDEVEKVLNKQLE